MASNSCCSWRSFQVRGANQGLGPPALGEPRQLGESWQQSAGEGGLGEGGGSLRTMSSASSHDV